MGASELYPSLARPAGINSVRSGLIIRQIEYYISATVIRRPPAGDKKRLSFSMKIWIVHRDYHFVL
jgi:hypothetical protein